MTERKGFFVVLLFSLLLAGNLFAQNASIPSPFATGQAAHFVLGQTNFSDITADTSQTRWGATSGIAIAGNKLIVSDSSYLAPPNNNRVLIYNDLKALRTRLPQYPLPAADVVLGQPDFLSSNVGTTAESFNQPVGVASDGIRLFIADWGNNRVLIYNRIPTTNDAPADIVVGQQDFTSSAAAAGPAGLRRPNSVWSDGARLFIADTLNNRVLIYNHIPTTNGATADVVLGQTNFDGRTALPVAANTLSSPMSVTSDGQRLIITDLANNRVLIYNHIPTQSGVTADVVVGQPDFVSNAPGNTQTSLDFPRYAYSDGTRLVIVDSGNNRILIYNHIPTQNGAAADIVLGQADFLGLMESCAASNLAVPFAAASDGDMLYVSDALNRRILGFRPGPSLINMLGVVNAASFSAAPQTQACQVTLPEPPVAPGSMTSIFGTNLADTTASAGSLPLPTKLGGVQVKFNGIAAPIFFVSPTQINVQVPFELTGYSGSVEIEKDTATGTVVSSAAAVGLANGAPGIFTLDGTGKGPAVMVHADYTPVTADSPALPGETVTVFCTGLGTVDNIMEDGGPATFGAQGSVTIGGTAAAGSAATIVVNGVSYSYTAVSGDSLDQVTAGLANLIATNDPLVTATADIANEVVNLTARQVGEQGTSITYSASVPSGSQLTATSNNSIVVPGGITFGGTPEGSQVITVTLGGTDYTYVTTPTDTIASIIQSLTDAINADVNVQAMADVPDSRILLSLRDPTSGLQVTYTATVQPAGSTITVVTDNAHLTPGTAPATNIVSATIGKALPLIPGSVLFGGTSEPGETITIHLADTPYTYTTVDGDTLQSIVTNMTNLLNGDPNVTATADTTNATISLALKNTSNQITFDVSVTGGTSLIAVPQSNTTTGSEAATVEFAGLVAGYAGLYQVNLTIPTDAAANPATVLTLTQNLIVFGSVTSTNIVSNEVTFPIGTSP